MTTNELRELDRWLWKNVLGWSEWKEEEYPHRRGWSLLGDEGEKRLEVDMDSPTTDPAAALLVLEKCFEFEVVTAQKSSVTEHPWLMVGRISRARACAETLPLTISLFAKKLFSKAKP